MDNHYVEYYLNQAGVQEKSQKYYKNDHKLYIKGGGIGGTFATVFRYLKPFIASGIDILREESIKTATDVLLGIAQQKPMKEIIADKSVELVDKIRDTAVKKIGTMTGGGLKKPLKRIAKRKNYQSSSDNPRERSNSSSLLQYPLNKKKKKERELDIFDDQKWNF